MTLDSAHIDESIARALRGESHLDPEVLQINGFSTPTMRHLFNNLCRMDGIVYCEVGVFKGASFVAAFYNNVIYAIGIDDFSQDFSQGDIKTALLANIERWNNKTGDVKFIESDCFAWAEASSARGFIDVLTYDGHHDTAPTAKALPAFFDLLADTFLFIVDDCSWSTVAEGSKQGFESLRDKVKIDREWKLYGARRNDDEIWHNGLALYLCSKIH